MRETEAYESLGQIQAGGRKRGSLIQHSIGGELYLLAAKQLHAGGVEQVFQLLYFPGQACRTVVVLNRHLTLTYDSAAVQFTTDKMNAAAVFLLAGVQCPLMGVQTFEFW